MRKKLIWATLLIPLVVSLMMVSPATSSGTNMIYVDPAVVWDPDMPIGTEFPVDIRVDYVNKLLIYQFHLYVDPTVLHVVSVANGPFLASAGGTPDFYPGEGFEDDPEDPNYGWLYLVVGALPPPPSTPPPKIPSGGGVLATVTFIKVGDGSSTIELGEDCGLINPAGDFISKGVVEHGFFSNEPGPELYVRTRGAHGTSGCWPEWTVGLTGDLQTLYCRVMNYGLMGADVKVEFRVRCDGGEFTPYWSNEAPIDPAIDIGEPSTATVSASFAVDAEGQYRVCVVLYFKAGSMTTFVPYCTVEEALGGEGVSRDIPVVFKC